MANLTVVSMVTLGMMMGPIINLTGTTIVVEIVAISLITVEMDTNIVAHMVPLQGSVYLHNFH